MAMNARQFVAAQLATTIAPIYTAPTGTKAVTKRVILTNTTGTAATVLVHVVTNGGSVADGNMALNQLSVGGGETYIASELEGLVVEAGGSIQAQASVSGTITAIISGVEIT
jgi:hypothetical protein